MKEKEIEFIGKITAGVTHEVNNVLASIREISGLMTDIISVADEQSFPRKEKFQNSLQKIQNQVERGVKLASQLNRFSHLSDNDVGEINLNELINHLVFLTERFARLKNITLQNKSSDQSTTLITSPLQLQMALFYGILYILNHLVNGSEISISHRKEGDDYSVHITYAGEVLDKNSIFKDSDSSEELLSLQIIIKHLNGVYSLDELMPGILIKVQNMK